MIIKKPNKKYAVHVVMYHNITFILNHKNIGYKANHSYVYRYYSKTHIGLCCSILPLRIILPSS